MAKPPKTLKFEQAISKLEQMVEKLESGDLPLEESLKVFEDGMEMTQFCEKKLTEAEGKVETLLKSNKTNQEEK